MRGVIVIPRFKGGSFGFIATTLCRFLNDNGYNCDVKYLNDKIPLKHSDAMIFVGNINDSSVIRATMMSLFSKIKLFYAVTEGPYYGYLKRLSKIFTIVVPSCYVKKELEDSGLKVKRVIPHGINVKEYKLNFMKYEEPAEEVKEVHGLKEKGYVLLFSVISEDIPRKGLKCLLDAIRITPTSNRFKLVIRGNVSCPTDLNDKVIVLKRFLSRKDLIALYNLADACIVPSLAEGFGLPIIESFAAGKPVVSLNAQPMNEINDDKTGWLVRVSKQVIVRGWPSSYRFNIPDIDDYAHKIAECVDNDKLRREKGVNALKKAYLYDYRQTYKGFLDFL